MLGLTLAASARDLHEVRANECILDVYVQCVVGIVVRPSIPSTAPIPTRPHPNPTAYTYTKVLHEELLDCSFVNSLNPWGAWSWHPPHVVHPSMPPCLFLTN